jgi:beta-glucosidase
VEKSRFRIPLLFAADIPHGFKTLFPIPLAQAASWDVKAVEEAERIVATEATAAGIHLNFAPMVDLCRNSRWDRIAGTGGEDPFLSAEMVAARVRGLQGESLQDERTMAACIKIYTGSGDCDAASVHKDAEMAERMLHDVYLPPLKAALDAGVSGAITTFNKISKQPGTGGEFLFGSGLRKDLGFDGALIAGWKSIAEMTAQGHASSIEEATALTMKAGIDVDMMSEAYLKELPKLVESGKLDVSYIDQAVKRVLRLKYELGLFDDPYKYCSDVRENTEIRSEAHLAAARDMARKSIVLLKNEKNLLPLKKDAGTIAVIGPFADNKADMIGLKPFFGEEDHTVSILEGIREKVAKQSEVLFAQGCNFQDSDPALLKEALAVAKKADVIILAIGEQVSMDGGPDLQLSQSQQELMKQISKTGKPVIALVAGGRPLDLSWLDANIPSILAVWALGSEAGNAIADVIFGDYNPSGRLPVSFPRGSNPAPVYYNYKNANDAGEGIGSSENPAPLYGFGYGLGYSEFEYSAISLSKTTMDRDGKIYVFVMVRNNGLMDGEAVVQMYISDIEGSVPRPEKALKGFQKIFIRADETKELRFEIRPEMLSFFRKDKTFGPETGKFKVFVGNNPEEGQEAEFELTD